MSSSTRNISPWVLHLCLDSQNPSTAWPPVTFGPCDLLRLRVQPTTNVGVEVDGPRVAMVTLPGDSGVVGNYCVPSYNDKVSVAGSLELPIDEPFVFGRWILLVQKRSDETTTGICWADETLAEENGPRLQTRHSEFASQLGRLEKVACSRLPVLITGETGTGKELVARYVHRRSKREGRFVAVNCAALTDTVAHSQLFGHVRGAFSGAVDSTVGFVRASDGGTLFLDEVSELSLNNQASLLRVLQESEVTPVGSAIPVPVDIRLVAACNRLPADLVNSGFRVDLLARLHGYMIELPPLRERPSDIGIVVANVLKRITAAGRNVRFTTAAALHLVRHAWPFNIRELESCLRLAVTLSDANTIEVSHLNLVNTNGMRGVAAPMNGEGVEPHRKSDERYYRLLELLEKHEGNVTAVSATVGKTRVQVHRWIKRYNIDVAQFRSNR